MRPDRAHLSSEASHRMPLAHAGADVVQDDLASDPVQTHGTAWGQEGEASLDLLADLLCRSAQQSPVAKVEAESSMRVADEVEDGQASLAFMQPQPAAQLLEEDGGGLRGAQEEHRIDLRDVHTFVEEVDSEQRGELCRSRVRRIASSRSPVLESPVTATLGIPA